MVWAKGQSGNPLGSNVARQGSAELELRKVAQRFTRPALATAVSIMRNRNNEPRTRLAAADLILNRALGKPIQPHSNPDLSPLNWNEMSTEELMAAMQRLQDALGDHADNQLPVYNPVVHAPDNRPRTRQ